MSMRTPLGRVLGLGSAKEGTRHWWAQRVSAVAMVPLSLWLVISLLVLGTLEYQAVISWMTKPVNAIALLLLLVTLFYHSSLGIQVILEDYVHSDWVKITTLLLSKFFHVTLAFAAVFAVLKIAFGASN